MGNDEDAPLQMVVKVCSTIGVIVFGLTHFVVNPDCIRYLTCRRETTIRLFAASACGEINFACGERKQTGRTGRRQKSSFMKGSL